MAHLDESFAPVTKTRKHGSLIIKAKRKIFRSPRKDFPELEMSIDLQGARLTPAKHIDGKDRTSLIWKGFPNPTNTATLTGF
jgi:hypothetical protein